MAYSQTLAAALGGVTEGQLVHWRRPPNPVLVPEYGSKPRVSYSFRDLLAIRTVARIRTELSLQKIRKAIQNIKNLDNFQHLSNYTLVAKNRSIVWIQSPDQMVDVLDQPGQHVIATMQDILGEFVSWTGETVVPLERPKPGIRINAAVLRGFPVIDNTRVPYDTIASLAADGLEPAAIRYFYPSVTDVGVEGAVALDRYVSEYPRRAA